MEEIEVKPVLVVDIPSDTTAEQAEELLKRPYGDYYLVAVVAWDGLSARAFYRRRGLWRGGAGSDSGMFKTGGNKADRDGKDQAAKAIIRANSGTTISALIAKLAEAGIERKKSWVSVARIEARGVVVYDKPQPLNTQLRITNS